MRRIDPWFTNPEIPLSRLRRLWRNRQVSDVWRPRGWDATHVPPRTASIATSVCKNSPPPGVRTWVRRLRWPHGVRRIPGNRFLLISPRCKRNMGYRRRMLLRKHHTLLPPITAAGRRHDGQICTPPDGEGRGPAGQAVARGLLTPALAVVGRGEWDVVAERVPSGIGRPVMEGSLSFARRVISRGNTAAGNPTGALWGAGS